MPSVADNEIGFALDSQMELRGETISVARAGNTGPCRLTAIKSYKTGSVPNADGIMTEFDTWEFICRAEEYCPVWTKPHPIENDVITDDVGRRFEVQRLNQGRCFAFVDAGATVIRVHTNFIK